MGDNNITNFQYQPNWTASTASDSYAAAGPGALATGGASTANPEKLALAFLSKMSQVGTGQYGAAQGVRSVAAAQGAQGGPGARFSGQTFSATMPPPSAPKVQFNTSTQASFNSFAVESKAAMQNVGTWASQQPSLQQGAGATMIKPGSNTMSAVAGDTAGWLTNASMGAQGFANGGLYAFMKLRLENTDASINAMQNLAGTSSDLQGTMAEQQAAQAEAAQKEAQKSQKKAGILGVFQKIFAVIIAVVLVMVACLTMQPELAALGIAMAAIAFAAAGAAKGKGKGGFDFWGGLEWFNNVAGLAGLSAILTSAAKVGMDFATKGVTDTLAQGAKEAATGAAQAGERSGTSLTESGAEDAANTAAQTGKAAAATGDAAGGSAAATSKAEMLSEEISRESEKTVQKGAAEAIAAKNGDATHPGLYAAFKSAMAANLTKATGCNTMTEYGTMEAKAGAAIGLTQGADSMGSAEINLKVSLYQANADEDMAHFQQLKSMVKMLDSSYKTANDLVQTLVKSHSNAVDQTQAMLKGNNDVQSLIATNMSQI